MSQEQAKKKAARRQSVSASSEDSPGDGMGADSDSARQADSDSMPPPPVNTQIINDAANAAAAAILEAPPEIGNRSPGIWSVVFQGGTFERVKQRYHIYTLQETACDIYIYMCIWQSFVVSYLNQQQTCHRISGAPATSRSISRPSTACPYPACRRRSSISSHLRRRDYHL